MMYEKYSFSVQERESMRGSYRCMFYVDNRYTEEIVYAQNNFAAKALIEARYSGVKLRWAMFPQLAEKTGSRF